MKIFKSMFKLISLAVAAVLVGPSASAPVKHADCLQLQGLRYAAIDAKYRADDGFVHQCTHRLLDQGSCEKLANEIVDGQYPPEKKISFPPLSAPTQPDDLALTLNDFLLGNYRYEHVTGNCSQMQESHVCRNTPIGGQCSRSSVCKDPSAKEDLFYCELERHMGLLLNRQGTMNFQIMYSMYMLGITQTASDITDVQPPANPDDSTLAHYTLGALFNARRQAMVHLDIIDTLCP